MTGPSQSWLDRIESLIDTFDTAGLRRAAAKRAYRAARRDWPGLPEPVFDELAELGIRLMNDFHSEGPDMGESIWPASLSAFIETALLSDLAPHLVIEFRGKRLQLKAKTAAGRVAMTWLLETGVELAGNVREVLTRLVGALPEDAGAQAQVQLLQEMEG